MAAGENHEVYFDWRCNKCEDDDILTEGTAYCKSCNKCFCEKCVNDHNRFLKGHTFLDQTEKDDWGKATTVTPQDAAEVECSEHRGQKITMYCGVPDHDDVCCSVCAFMHHGEACRPHMKYIPSIAKGVVNSAEFQTFIATNDSLIASLDQIEEQRTDFISALRDSREACQKDADIAWQNFIKRLEGLKKKSDIDINNTHDAEESIAQSDIDKCVSAKRELNCIKTNVPTSQPVNESSLFVQMKIGQKKQREYTKVCEVINDQDLKTYSFEAERRIYQVSLPTTLGKCVKKGPKVITDQRPITEVDKSTRKSDGNFALSAEVPQKLETNICFFDDDEYKHQMEKNEGTSKMKARGRPFNTTSTKQSYVQRDELLPLVSRNIDLELKSDARAFKTDEGVEIYVYKASILKVNVDCIVSGSNGFLNHSGGVAKVIADAAGPHLRSECYAYVKAHGKVPVGSCYSSSAGKLPYRRVIQAIGPCWYDYSPHTLQRVQECEMDLYNTIMNSLLEAEKAGLKTIALLPISSGIFVVPEELCVYQYAKATLDYSRNTQWTKNPLREIHFVDMHVNKIQRIQQVFDAFITRRTPPCYDTNEFVKSKTLFASLFRK